MADPPIVADCADETASQEPDDDRVTMTKSSRKRRTNAEIAAANEAELQHLKQMDTSGWTVKRRESHEAEIDNLIALVETQKEKLQKNSQKNSQKVSRSKSSAEASSTLKRAPAMNDEQTRRLIYARAVMDYEFEKQINAGALKWQMVALKYNKGFTVKKTFLIGVDNDIVFPPLPDGMHADGCQLQRKFEKICGEYRNIILFRQKQDREVAKRSHMGEKRSQDAILTEVLEELREMEAKFKFCDDMKVARWDGHAFLNPPSRVNVRDPVAVVSVSPSPSGASGSLSATDAVDTHSEDKERISDSESGHGEPSPGSSVSPGSEKVLGRMGGKKRSLASMRSYQERQRLKNDSSKFHVHFMPKIAVIGAGFVVQAAGPTDVNVNKQMKGVNDSNA